MSRIDEKFAQLRKEGRIAFMPFLVAGDPNFENGLRLAEKIIPSADLLEIGFPYSDPLADGPIIQAADNRALAASMNTDRVFAFIKEIRKISEIPISVLVYANLVYQRGIKRFYRDAKKSGIDGVLIPDVPVEESSPFVDASRKADVDPIFLVTQTTTQKRLKKILVYAKGYLYLVSVLGVTGTRATLASEMPRVIRSIKKHTDLPLAVGFGISKKEHIHALHTAGADGAIVGSALVKIIGENSDNKDRLLSRMTKAVRAFV